MANIIYDLKIVNEKIREDLKRELPNFSFSVRKDSGRIYITILSGNIKPFKAFTQAEEKGYIDYSINQYYIDDENSLSDAGKQLVKKVKSIADNYNYDNSDIYSDYSDKNFYLSMYVGTREKPYVYKPSNTSSTSRPNTRPTSRPSRPSATNSDDEHIYRFKSGWDLYKRIVKDKIVFVLAKQKETPTNREDWATIKGEILTETGFKWSPQYQVFTKWDKLPDSVFENLERILFKYYVTATPNATQQTMAQVTATPQQKPEIAVNVADLYPQIEIAQSTASAVTTRVNDLLKTFKEPKDVNDLEVRKFIINTMMDRVERVEPHELNKNFLEIYAPQIFDSIYVPSNGMTYHIADGIKMEFTPQTLHRKTKKDLLLRIMDLAGCWAGLDVVFGVYVDIEGDVMSEERKKYAEKIAKENGREVYIEDFHVGGTLRYRDFYALYNTLKVAKNFLNNEFEASFKNFDVTEKFEKIFANRGDVRINEEDWEQNEIWTQATLYTYRNDVSFVYILKQKDYSGLYSNSFNLGYAMMQKLIKQDSGLVQYLGDVDPFGDNLGVAKKEFPSLQENFSDLTFIMPNSRPEEDKAIVQAQINELENFLKISGEMDEEDKKVILSQILDLHTLLKLI